MKTKNLQLIIFGASGDLASLKLFPAIHELFAHDLLPSSFQIVGFGRGSFTTEQFRKVFRKSLGKHLGKFGMKAEQLLKHVYYVQGQYAEVEDFTKLEKFCLELNNGHSSEQIAYFSVPPLVFGNIVQNLSLTLKKKATSFKIILEKPFGTSEKTAQSLFKTISSNYDENQVYLLDHYLGKRPIQSILKLRLENNVINLMIRGQEIDHIDIEASEESGVGTRVRYYDQVGAIKDMLQSHLLQVLSLITMDIPISLDLDSLQREKHNILSAIKFSGDKNDLIIAQYTGYDRLKDVKPKSRTETFVAVKLFIDRRDWFNVPVFIRTGKMLEKSLTRVTIVFKKMTFQEKPAPNNKLIFEMKPGEQLSLKLIQKATLKDPEKKSYEEVDLAESLGCHVDFCLGDYASLLNDVQRGIKTYFLSYPEIVAAWKVVDKIERTITKKKIPLLFYKQHSSGPNL